MIQTGNNFNIGNGQQIITVGGDKQENVSYTKLHEKLNFSINCKNINFGLYYSHYKLKSP